ncbi:Hypothetical predicted protein, partial [Paramuricea clavata]
QILGLQPYHFEPVIDTIPESSESDDDYSSEEEDRSRLDNLDWSQCEHCQIIDRVEECVCCHEIPEIMNKNEEVFETDKLKEKPNCITDNPGKEIRVPLPSCAASCIRAHCPPPCLEEDFEFEGFHFADE